MGKDTWSDNSDITFMADETREEVIKARVEFQRRNAAHDHDEDLRRKQAGVIADASSEDE